MRTALSDGLFWVAVAACAVAQLFILRAVLRPAPTPTLPLPLPRRAQEIAWAILPSLLLAAAFVLAWRVMHPVPLPAGPVPVA